MVDAGQTVVGRFAPSPSGALHFGSLLAALASYLDARHRQGRWLLRMEDLDPAREPAGAADEILVLLDALHLHWDGDVLYQSRRHDAYAEALSLLETSGLTFPCTCSRRRVRARGRIYDGHCRNARRSPAVPHALRMKAGSQRIGFTDRIQGSCAQQMERDCGDFIIRRKDGLFAYQLAVVVDDAFQGVTDVVRGHDLLDSTPRQILLQRSLGLNTPRYAHIPVASDSHGQKLSKQHFARPLEPTNASRHIHQALSFLGQRPPDSLAGAPAPEQLDWATAHWDMKRVPAVANVPVDQ